MVKHIKRGVSPIISFLNKYKGNRFKLCLENQRIDISEMAVINYEDDYLYIDEANYEYMIKISDIKSIVVWK